jgi:hypothetical protein
MTAYRQQAILCAEALEPGPMRPRDIKPVAPDAGKILQNNYYGWFERVKPGVYQLTDLGRTAITPAGGPPSG